MRRLGLAVLAALLLLTACSDAGGPTDAGGSTADAPDPTTDAEDRAPTVAMRAGGDGCVTPDRDDWALFTEATGLGDLDRDGVDERVLALGDRASPVRAVVETGDGLAPLWDDDPDDPTGRPTAGPVVTVAGEPLVMLSFGGNTALTMGFARVDGCEVVPLEVVGEGRAELPWGLTGNACLPDCGAGVTCVPGGVEVVSWTTTALDDDGRDVAWADVADDPDLRADDLRVDVTRRRYSLGSAGLRAATPTTYRAGIGDGRLAQLRTGFVCGPIELSPLGEITGFGIDAETFDALREAS